MPAPRFFALAVFLAACLALAPSLFPWALLAIGLALAWPRLLQARALSRRRVQLAGQLPGIFESLAAALRAGQGFSQALASVGEDLPEPAAGLAREALRRVQLGEAPDAALRAAGADFRGTAQATDWAMLCTAVALARSSGGDLSVILDQLADTVRERERLQAQARAQTAQARLSAWVIGLLPPGLLLAVQLVDPDLARPLFTTAQGWGILAAAAGLEAAGAFLLSRMARVEA